MAAVDVAGVEISKPDKVLFPEDDISKRDLAEYYSAVAEVMVPHLRDRPVNMQRFPDGIDGQGFYEKKTPGHFPEWVQSVRVQTSDGSQQQVVVDDVRTLVYLADQACVTPHVWLSRSDRLEHPDQLVFDLDPSTDDLAGLRDATRAVADLLAEVGLTPFIKTTGSRGYHVQAVLDRSADFNTARDFARDLADLLAARQPERMTTEQRKNKRGDRIYLDYMRNAYAQTAVPAYAVRARPGAPVATPIEREELGRVRPNGHTITSVTRRLAQRADPWAEMSGHARSLDEPRERLRELAES
ncbi:MAG TPA: non-homologous end-joining DNA ligase [Nocardioidaceae bacterium]|nr:non-homologous end-joining DNA ligase [Nocardioidaceae bacterium]